MWKTPTRSVPPHASSIPLLVHVTSSVCSEHASGKCHTRSVLSVQHASGSLDTKSVCTQAHATGSLDTRSVWLLAPASSMFSGIKQIKPIPFRICFVVASAPCRCRRRRLRPVSMYIIAVTPCRRSPMPGCVAVAPCPAVSP